MIFQDAAKEFGTATMNGLTVALTQNAYPDNYGTDGGVRYYAHAVDKNGNTYIVAWDTTQEWDNNQQAYKDDPAENSWLLDCDESHSCDWDNPVSITEA